MKTIKAYNTLTSRLTVAGRTLPPRKAVTVTEVLLEDPGFERLVDAGTILVGDKATKANAANMPATPKKAEAPAKNELEKTKDTGSQDPESDGTADGEDEPEVTDDTPSEDAGSEDKVEPSPAPKKKRGRKKKTK